jgi:putative sterol carrier protein
MSDLSPDLIMELGQNADHALLRKAAGTVRFDLENGKRVEHLLLRIDEDGVSVSRKKAPADCVARGNEAIFARIATGEANAFAAVLRGEIVIDGDVRLLLLAQRVFSTSRAAAEKAS